MALDILMHWTLYCTKGIARLGDQSGSLIQIDSIQLKTAIPSGHSAILTPRECTNERDGGTQMASRTQGPPKVKVGTILDKKTVQRLKERSAKEGRPISAIIQDAVTRYEQAAIFDRAVRLKALDQLFSIRFNISGNDIRTIMEEDLFDQ